MEIIGDYLYTNDPHVNIYTKGDFQDYQFITLDKGIPEGSRFKYPIKKIKLILPTEYERSQQLPNKNLSYYVSAEPLKVLGKGTYGKVVQSGKYAIKTFFGDPKIKNPYLDSSLLREVAVLKRLNHPNIIKIIDVVSGDPAEPSRDVVSLVLPLAEGNLQDFLRTYGNSHSKEITYQILEGFNYLQSKDIVHSDIKPDNILYSRVLSDPQMDQKGHFFTFVISDFGLSIPTSCLPKSLHNYAYNLYYRPPEILFKLGYGLTADNWAIGCLIYSIYTGGSFLFYNPDDERPEFLSLSDSKKNDIVATRIFFTLGSPKGDWNTLWDQIKDQGYTFYDKGPQIRQRLGDDDIYDIFRGLVRYHPDKRTEFSEILKNSYFQSSRGSFLLSKEIQKGPFECQTILNMRQRYQTLVPLYQEPQRWDLKRVELSGRILKKLRDTKFDPRDYFPIMYLYDYTINILIKYEELVYFTTACLEIIMYYKYGNSPYDRNKINERWDLIDKYIKMILKILDYDLIFTNISDYLETPDDEVFSEVVRAVNKRLVQKFLPKDIVSSIEFHVKNRSFYEIIYLLES